MEVMSMKDLNKIPGGSGAQRKIAQDRQKAREAKNRGFDAKKAAQQDPLAKAAPGVKAPTAPTKASAATDPLKSATNKAGALALRSSPTKQAPASTPADKGASIVRTKRGGTGKEAVGAPRKSGPGVRTSGSETGPGSKSYPRETPDRKRGGDLVKYKAPKPSKPSKPSKSGINYGALAKKGLGAAKSVKDFSFEKANDLRKAAVDQNKKQKKVGTSSSGSLKGPEIRMYGDERF